MITTTIKQSAPLEQRREVCFLVADPTILAGRGSVRVQLCVKSRTIKSYAFHYVGGAACVVPADEVAALGLRIGDRVAFEVTPQILSVRSQIPADLAAVLKQEKLDLSVLPPREQHQLLLMIKEARNMEIRQLRIAAAVAVCQAKSATVSGGRNPDLK